MLLASLPLVPRGLQASIHLNTVLLVSFGSYAYRDLFPLATFTLVPQDLAQGWLLWAKIVVLAVAAVVIPLSMPRPYIPLDPENPMVEPNPEQTASLFSSLTYSYLDSSILKSVVAARKQDGLTSEKLPALADYDRVEYLIRRSFHALDPLSEDASKHLLYGLLRVYRPEYIWMISLAVGNFAGPAVLNRLLASLENTELVVRPWVWVALLFFVPFFRSMSQARYVWFATRQRAQAEGIMVQLLFAHSLRIRMNSETKDSNKRNLVGRINNLSTSDVANLTSNMDLWILVMLSPLQITLAISFLYLILGWSSFVGLAVILITLPIPSYLATVMRKAQIASRQTADVRVQQVTETMNVLRMIKWFAWESKIKEDIAAKREEELIARRTVRLLVVLNKSINFIIPLLVMFATLSTYTLIMKQELTASVVFTSLAIFDGMLRQEIRRVMDRISDLTQVCKVSLDRVDDFLRTTELLDLYSSEDSSARDDDGRIGFRDAQFSWSSQVNDNDFKLRIGSEVIFQPGVINLIVGPTGVVKILRPFPTLILTHLVGEMHFNPAGPNPWVNLPRQGGAAYAPQQPWIENATIKQNIVFDTSVPFDETRYKKVLHACALYPDLELLDARDETEVGERGLTLSGGQKARVSLARAIYSTASTIILDDVLSSLDIHTAKWVVKNCLSSDLVQGRTVILVTHNIALTRPISQWVVSLNSDGSIVQGSVETVLKASHLPAADLEEEQKALEQDEKSGASDISSGPKGKLMVAEQMEQGMVKWHTCKSYTRFIRAQRSHYPRSNFGSWVIGPVNTWITRHPQSQFRCTLISYFVYLAIYSLSGLLAMAFYIVPYILYAFGMMRTDISKGKSIFALVTFKISPCAVDGNFAVSLLAKFTAVMILTPAFILPGAIIALISVLTGRIYMIAQLPIQRQMSAARSPMLAHFAAAISGLTSIRAYGAEEAFSARIDYRRFWAALSLRRSDWYLVYGGGVHRGPANVGFSLSAAVLFSSTILSWVRITNALQLDTEPSSLERIVQYLGIEQEPKPTQAGVPPAYWPASGEIRAENLSAKYSTDSPEILHGLNFAIKSGERIAIVGRTGSGKSSLTLALLRSIPTEGKIYYDGIPIDSLNLDALRSSITIIPQVPELLGGTLRRNLDPFEAHEDSVLNDALRAADSLISSEGGNLSLGERQIVAFARAIVRGSKLLILDEDHETDVIIQSTVRNELKGVSVLTVAHRLQTVMDYDRIMVLEAGRIIELDTPSNL
ncbi:P-loop containing nucleoside triphosphate hydrolase protein [Mycena olivaceomarginata]|nr:P-loop containing nucleoside triphosphate hydrolase protein [Mycena olivaceomarginata]